MKDMKKKISCMALLGLTVLVIGGCGQKADDADSAGRDVSGEEAFQEDALSEEASGEASSGGTDSGDSAFDGETSDSGEDAGKESETVYEEPPEIVLHPVSEGGDSLPVRPCGYSWNWPLDAGQMGAAIADGPSPTSEGTHWDTLMLPENSNGMSEYRLTIGVTPDELGVEAWEMTDMGNNDAAADWTVVYQKAEIDADDFAISLQTGKIYQIYMVWDEENADENGCFGAACYVFMTARSVQEGADGAVSSSAEGQPEFPEASFGEIFTEEISSIDGVTITVKDVTPEGAGLEILNRTDKEITFGDDYELQAWQDGNWHRVDYIIDNWAFNSIGYETGPEGAKDSPLCLDVKWAYFHGILPEGHYRITKTALVGENKDYVTYELAAEFEVE